MRQYWVYILASPDRQLYIGVTNNLALRVAQHRLQQRGFSAERRTTKLVYCEVTTDVRAAIAREKELKGWKRRRKIEMIDSMNPLWLDLLPPS